MRIRTTLLAAGVATALGLGVTAGAEAAVTLHTPTLFVPDGQNARCTVTNVSQVDYSMDIDALDNNGDVFIGFSPATLEAGNSRQVSFGAVGGKWLRCRFVGGGASKNNFRGAIVTPTAILPAQ